MSIADPMVVDRVAKRPGGAAISLIATDHLEWGLDDDQAHRDLVLHKLGNYVGYCHSGDLYRDYPDAEGRKIWVEVITQYSLTPAAVEFYRGVRESLATEGLSFDVRSISESGQLGGSLLP